MKEIFVAALAVLAFATSVSALALQSRITPKAASCCASAGACGECRKAACDSCPGCASDCNACPGCGARCGM